MAVPHKPEKLLCEACSRVANESEPMSVEASRDYFTSIVEHFNVGAIKSFVLNGRDAERLSVVLHAIQKS